MDILNARYVPPEPKPILPPGFALRRCTEARYWEMLQILPPVGHVGEGFMVGEPFDHRVCFVTGKTLPSFSPFVAPRREGGWHYEGSAALTMPEWRRLVAVPEHLVEAIRLGLKVQTAT